MSTGQPEPRWPPKSPHEALLSSPSGRSRVRNHYDRGSPSPSPFKRPGRVTMLESASKGRSPGQCGFLEIEEEDEETLRLQLQAIEARIKLKRLQRSKAKPEQVVRDKEVESHTEGAVISASRESPAKRVLPSVRRDVQIPVSPQRHATTLNEVKSPSRVLLGIDKGLKGRNVSLRKPAKLQDQLEDPFVSAHSDSRAVNHRDFGSAASQTLVPKRSFSQKIADVREQDKSARKRTEQAFAKRSNGFGIAQRTIDHLRDEAEDKLIAVTGTVNDKQSDASNGFSRDQVLQGISQAEAENKTNRQRTQQVSSKSNRVTRSRWSNPNTQDQIPALTFPKFNGGQEEAQTDLLKPVAVPRKGIAEVSLASDKSSETLFDPFSVTHLTKRLLPHNLLTQTFTNKSVFRISDLLAVVKSPEYCLPEETESDHVVLATIAAKSAPISHKDNVKLIHPSKTTGTSYDEADSSLQNAKGKYMILTLTDLKWTLDLYLFTTAYTRFYKLSPGTVIALLNPSIMPPPTNKLDTGRFSLTLHSSDDTVLEIGTARDLSWCKAICRNGKPCSDWIDKRHTDFCEFHIDRVVERTRRGRMETQGMSAPFAPGGRQNGRTGHFGAVGGRKGQRIHKKEDSHAADGFKIEGAQYDRSTSTKFFVGPAMPGRHDSAARLLDAEGSLGSSRGQSKEEHTRKRLALQEKENAIAQQLGANGNGAGSDYLRFRQANIASAATLGSTSKESSKNGEGDDPVDAASLGLLGNKAVNVHLSPLKGVKRKILAENLNAKIPASSRKKTRFVTDGGIKEAGRDSLPGPSIVRDLSGNNVDEDDLEIE